MTTQSRSYWPDQAHRETDRGPATGGCSLCQRMSWMRLITQPTRRARRSSTTTPASWNIIQRPGLTESLRRGEPSTTLARPPTIVLNEAMVAIAPGIVPHRVFLGIAMAVSKPHPPRSRWATLASNRFDKTHLSVADGPSCSAMVRGRRRCPPVVRCRQPPIPPAAVRSSGRFPYRRSQAPDSRRIGQTIHFCLAV